GCDFLMVSGWAGPGPGWRLIACGMLAAVAGGVAGCFLAPRSPLAGLLAGARNQALLGVVAFAGLIPGAGVYQVLRAVLPRTRGARAARAAPPSRPSGRPFAVFDDLPPEPPDPRAAALEERLLHLCKQDRRLFDRLLHYEQAQHPEMRRVELLRLAIEH